MDLFGAVPLSENRMGFDGCESPEIEKHIDRKSGGISHTYTIHNRRARSEIRLYRGSEAGNVLTCLRILLYALSR